MVRPGGRLGSPICELKSVDPFDEIKPFDYLKDLFTRLPSAKITEIKQFMPPG
jgi:hypothetical protein